MSEQSESPDTADDKSTAEITVPEDFPRDPFPSGLSGTQPKFSARLIDGKYVVGLTQEERAERYVGCLDLVDQLAAYVNRKQVEKPDVTLAALVDNVASRIPHQGWELGLSEVDWMVKQLRARFPEAQSVQ
nr:hypothetical protein [Rhodoferax sp.]